MIKQLAQHIKKFVFGDEASRINKISQELEICKSDISNLHLHFEQNVETIEDEDIKKSFEDVHFDDLYELHNQEKELQTKLSSSLNKYLEKLQKGESKLKYQDKMKSSLGKKRTEMPQVDSDNVADFVLHFDKKVGVKKVNRKLSKLKPAQDEINEDKLYHFAAGKFSDSDKKKNKYIISNDNYILDGHHRWAADVEFADDNEEVECYRINLPAKELIRQANRLKMTKQVDIDDKTFKKAILTIAKAKQEGFIKEDLLELVKAKTAGLVPVRRTVMKNGIPHSQIFWVRPNQVEATSSKTKKPELADKKRFKQQQEDDSITNIGDRVDVNYLGRSTGEKFNFKNLKVVDVKDNEIHVEIPETITTKKRYSDGMKVVFRKGAVIKIPKNNNIKWSKDNSYTLNIDAETRKERLQSLNFLDNIKKYSKEAKKKGYSIYEDTLTMNDEQIQAKYAPFFAKYGNSFNPAKMFDECSAAIKERFSDVEVDIDARFTTSGFTIRAKDKATGKELMTTTRKLVSGHQLAPADSNKGVYHEYFAIHNKKYWGGGLAKKLFCSYYEQYQKMGLEFLSVTAGLASGPYVWPSFGFYGTVDKARSVMNHFKEGRSRQIYTHYPEQHDDNIEKAYKEGNRIYIKYKDSERPVDVTNEMTNSSGEDYTEDKKILDAALLSFNKNVDKFIEVGEGPSKLDELYGKHIGGEMPWETKSYDIIISEIKTAITAKEGSRVKKYAVDGTGEVHEPAKAITHVITKQEEEHAKKVFNNWYQRNSKADLFPNTLFTGDPVLKQAAKVAFLNSGGTGYVVNLKNESHKKDFEKRIGFNKYLKEKYGEQ